MFYRDECNKYMKSNQFDKALGMLEKMKDVNRNSNTIAAFAEYLKSYG